MLLPLAVLYYKLNQFDRAKDYLKRLAAVNKDTKKFFRAAAGDRLEEFFMDMSPYGYRPFTIDELLEDLLLSPCLFASVPHFSSGPAATCAHRQPPGKESSPDTQHDKP